MTVTALVASVLMTGATAQTRYQANDHRPIATPAPYPENMVDDSRRPGFNGRLWVDRTIVGGAPREWPIGWGDPGPAHYGAPENSDPLVYVRRNTLVIGVHAWTGFENENLYPLENGRRFWLREQGWTGGVRTHINPAVRQGLIQSTPFVIEPRARFRAPEDAPKIRSRMQVRAPGRGLDDVRVFLPDSAPSTLRERVETRTTLTRAD